MLVSQTEEVTTPPSIDETSISAVPFKLAYRTKWGKMYRGMAEDLWNKKRLWRYKGKVRLILTSPPFPLNRKKRYGNLQGEDYKNWLASFAPLFKELLEPRGSIVMEVGNAWEPGEPVMSPLALESLLEFLKKGDFKLCEQFVCYNKATLPGPTQWVNVERIRVKNAYTHVWWMSPSSHPWASNKRVLTPYSKAMLELLKKRKYNPGERHSEHVIGQESFFKDNKGAIPSNVIEFTNTRSHDMYLDYCRQHHLKVHPARMAMNVATFFVKFLTTPGKIVFDPFAGSNVTGAAAEQLGRHWISTEPREDYIATSRGRFPSRQRHIGSQRE
ncbi:MAG: site-specific DNA-methyltransferase [Thaumarchaeota archaeon]|nr:site-specific DNA-methyltransferase [Nitrososphaerota archaeon]